jgi:hypothetical protein
MERAKNFGRPANKTQPVIKYKPLDEFILKTHDVNVCGNVLDLPNLRPEAPYWIQ